MLDVCSVDVAFSLSIKLQRVETSVGQVIHFKILGSWVYPPLLPGGRKFSKITGNSDSILRITVKTQENIQGEDDLGCLFIYTVNYSIILTIILIIIILTIFYYLLNFNLLFLSLNLSNTSVDDPDPVDPIFFLDQDPYSILKG